MKQIENEFKELQKKNPYISSIGIFYQVIKGTNLTRNKVSALFNRLVDVDDYNEEEDYEELISYGLTLSKTLTQ